MSKFADQQFRADAAALIAKTVRECGTANPDAVRLALYAVWPKHISPLIWAEEVNRALGTLPAPAVRGPQQGGLFEGE